MRKHVKPAQPGAAIPDPERQRDLPAEGRSVIWTVHWARLAARGDVIATDEPSAPAPAPPADTHPAPKDQDDASDGDARPDAATAPSPKRRSRR